MDTDKVNKAAKVLQIIARVVKFVVRLLIGKKK